MARKRASMREGPLAELFRATEAAQRQAEASPSRPRELPLPSLDSGARAGPASQSRSTGRNESRKPLRWQQRRR